MITASLWVGTGSFYHVSQVMVTVRVRVWVNILGRASVRVRIKDKKSISRDNFL